MTYRDLEIAQIERAVRKKQSVKELVAGFDMEKLVQDLPKGYIETESELLSFKKAICREVSVMIPMDFDVMDQEAKDWKYPYLEQADYIFSDESTTQNLSLMDLTDDEVADDEFEALSHDIFEGLKKTTALTVINEKKMVVKPLCSYMDGTLPTLDEEAYIFLGLILLENKIFILSFNSLKHEQDYWYPILIGMLRTMRLEENVSGVEEIL